MTRGRVDWAFNMRKNVCQKYYYTTATVSPATSTPAILAVKQQVKASEGRGNVGHSKRKETLGEGKRGEDQHHKSGKGEIRKCYTRFLIAINSVIRWEGIRTILHTNVINCGRQV